jgi:hypothetical protein
MSPIDSCVNWLQVLYYLQYDILYWFVVESNW